MGSAELCDDRNVFRVRTRVSLLMTFGGVARQATLFPLPSAFELSRGVVVEGSQIYGGARGMSWSKTRVRFLKL